MIMGVMRMAGLNQVFKFYDSVEGLLGKTGEGGQEPSEGKNPPKDSPQDPLKEPPKET